MFFYIFLILQNWLELSRVCFWRLDSGNFVVGSIPSPTQEQLAWEEGIKSSFVPQVLYVSDTDIIFGYVKRFQFQDWYRNVNDDEKVVNIYVHFPKYIAYVLHLTQAYVYMTSVGQVGDEL